MRKAATRTKVATKSAAKAKLRRRRSPAELLNDLKTKREKLFHTMQARLDLMDAKIQKIENKYRNQIEIQQLVQDKSVAELQAELQEVRRKSQVIKRAMKQKA